MRTNRWVIVLLSLSLVGGCWPNEPPEPTDTFDGSTTMSPATPTPTPTATATALAEYQTPTSACPQDWVGLTVRVTETEELEYLRSIPACTSPDGSRVWVRNNSAVVWAMTFPADLTPQRTSQTKRAESFRNIVPHGSDQLIFVPGDQVVVDTVPSRVSLVVSDTLSVGWESHTIAVDELESWGGTYAVAALGGASAARRAVAQCTLSGYLIGDAIGKAQAPVSQDEVLGLMTDVLGVGVAGNKCWKATREIKTPVNASDDLASSLTRRLNTPSALEGIHTRMTWLQRSLVFGHILR